MRKKKKKEEERNYRMKIYMVSLLHRATITTDIDAKYVKRHGSEQGCVVSGDHHVGHWPTFQITGFIPIVDTWFSCEDIAGQSCAMVRRWRFFASFLCPVFPASRVQHISDLHSKFA